MHENRNNERYLSKRNVIVVKQEVTMMRNSEIY
jgi:hypothetical protein